VKEPDEKGGAEPDHLPSDEEDFDVAGERDAKHTGREHREQHEIPVVARLPMQIAVRERRHHTENRRGQRREREREAVDEELDPDAAGGRVGPCTVGQQPNVRRRQPVTEEGERERDA
jgi:hypothetical protein